MDKFGKALEGGFQRCNQLSCRIVTINGAAGFVVPQHGVQSCCAGCMATSGQTPYAPRIVTTVLEYQLIIIPKRFQVSKT